MYCLRYWARYVCKGEVKSGGIKIENESTSWILLLDSPFREITISVFIMENKEPLTYLMDFPFGPIHSSETPYLTINYVTPTHQINI